MSENHTAEQRLDADLNRLQRRPMEDGPSPQVLAATLAQLQTPKSPTRIKAFREEVQQLFRRPIMHYALILTAIACGVFAMLIPSRATIVLADVVEKLQQVQTLCYTETDSFPSGQVMITRTYVGTGGRMRMETLSSPEAMRRFPEQAFTNISIHDGRQMLYLSPRFYIASKHELGGPMGNAAEWLKFKLDMSKIDAKPIGKKQIGDIEAVGFGTTTLEANGASPATIWVDPKTNLPVRIEVQDKTMDGTPEQRVQSDFKINQPLDDALFSMDLPRGYTLHEEGAAFTQPPPLAVEVGKLLDTYSGAMDGQFPDSLMDADAYDEVVKKLGPARDDFLNRAGTIAAGLYASPGAIYLGKGQHRDDKTQPIFWVNPRPQQKGSRVVYGDLHIEMLSTDKLPTTQPAH